MPPTRESASAIPSDDLLDRRFFSLAKDVDILKMSKEEVIDLLFIAKCNSITVCYAPLHHLNASARLLLIGLTPGWSQMQISLKVAANIVCSYNSFRPEHIRKAHLESYFAGRMRTNLIKMLDSIGVNDFLEISSTSSLFQHHHHLMHATSVFKYPVFNKFKNYTGYGPSPESNSLLRFMVENTFAKEISGFRGCVAIPFGKIASSCLDIISDMTDQIQIIHGFPHPSPANGHRLSQLHANLESLRSQISCFC